MKTFTTNSDHVYSRFKKTPKDQRLTLHDITWVSQLHWFQGALKVTSNKYCIICSLPSGRLTLITNRLDLKQLAGAF